MLAQPPRHAVPVAPGSGDEIPRWFVWASLILVAGPSFYALAWFQHRLFAGMLPEAPGVLTYGLAVAVDSFGIVSGAYWFRSRRNRQLRGWGRFFAIAAVVGSTVLTCWAINRMTGGAATALGVIPAVIVFGTTKLVTMWQADRSANRDVLAEAAAQVAAAEARADTAAEQMERVEAERDARDAEIAARLVELERRAHAAEARAERAEAPREVVDTGPIPVQDRTAQAPGSSVTNIAATGSMAAKGREFVLGFVAEHGREPTGGEVESAIGAKDSYGRKLLARMRKAGDLPDLAATG